MKIAPASPGGLFLRTVLWLIPALAGWYLAREWMIGPPVWLAETAMQLLFPRWAEAVELGAEGQTLVTRLRIFDADMRLGDLTAHANALVYCYGFTLLAALLLASRARGLWWKLPLGFVVLLPFQVWGICMAWLVQVAVVSGEQTVRQTGLGPWAANLIAAGYQLGYLILPTLAPVVVWLVLDRRALSESRIAGH